MPFRVAVASSDGREINEHFGWARHFLIYYLTEGKFKLGEVREIDSPHCGAVQHDGAALDEIAESLSDCRLVLASRIGPGAAQLLRLKGIQSFEVADSIDQTLAKLVNSYEVKNYQRSQG